MPRRVTEKDLETRELFQPLVEKVVCASSRSALSRELTAIAPNQGSQPQRLAPSSDWRGAINAYMLAERTPTVNTIWAVGEAGRKLGLSEFSGVAALYQTKRFDYLAELASYAACEVLDAQIKVALEICRYESRVEHLLGPERNERLKELIQRLSAEKGANGTHSIYLREKYASEIESSAAFKTLRKCEDSYTALLVSFMAVYQLFFMKRTPGTMQAAREALKDVGMHWGENHGGLLQRGKLAPKKAGGLYQLVINIFDDNDVSYSYRCIAGDLLFERFTGDELDARRDLQTMGKSVKHYQDGISGIHVSYRQRGSGSKLPRPQ